MIGNIYVSYIFQSEKATNKSLEGIDYAAHKLLNYKLRGDSPSHVTSGLMTLTVTRQSPKDITSAALNGGKVNFQIPSEVKNVKLGQVAVVNTKVKLTRDAGYDVLASHHSTLGQTSS